MIYLEKFYFVSKREEEKYLNGYFTARVAGNQYHTNYYPFGIMAEMGLNKLEFEPITILYGDNGCGKSTVLNVMAKKLKANRKSLYNSGEHMGAYVERCFFESDLKWCGEEYDVTRSHSDRYDISQITRIITSDDIFKCLQQDRMKQEQYLMKSRMLATKAVALKRGDARWDGYVDFEGDDGSVERLEESCRIRKRSVTQFLKDKLKPEEVGMSNGENSFVYISNMMQEEGLYLLDEPENSLSPQMQLKLAELLLFMARYNNCQIIMATHSPLLLSIPCAKIYNLDSDPVCVSRFQELASTKLYYNFFKERQDLFESDSN